MKKLILTILLFFIFLPATMSYGFDFEGPGKDVAFTWDPKPTTRAAGLIKLDQIVTNHTYGYHGMFKPSIAEVLCQIPEKYLNDVVAFETEYGGMAGEYHSGVTTLYRHR